MARYAEPMARLIEELKKLPGVGTKTAQRFAFHILRSNDEDAAALAEAVRGLKQSLRLCSDLQQRHRRRSLCLLLKHDAKSAPRVRCRRADQH